MDNYGQSLALVASKTIACPSCKRWVQMTLYGTQNQCICGHVLTTRSAAAETQRETSVRGRGDHKGIIKQFGSFQTKESSSNNSSSTSDSSRNSVKQSYTGTGPSSCSDEPVSSGSRPNNSSSTSSSTCSSSRNSFKQSYRGRGRGTGTGTLMSLPPSPSEEPVPRGSRPNKRALLCGVTYKQHKYKLKGTYNDVKNMENLLKTFGFPANCIRILSENDLLDLERIPTKKNIENSLKWLVEGCQRGDSLVFYFSGHGLRQPDFKDDELDGFDETICPVDFMKEGMILDNDINETIVWPLEEGVTLHAIVDACQSGTILDLEHVYDHKLNVWKDNRPPSRARKSTKGGLAISLGTCEDDKMAADTTAFAGKSMNGAMTYILTETVKKKTDITYGVLLDEMVNYIKKINSERWTNSRFLRTVLRHKTIQEPMLSSSEKFDVNLKKFVL